MLAVRIVASSSSSETNSRRNLTPRQTPHTQYPSPISLVLFIGDRRQHHAPPHQRQHQRAVYDDGEKGADMILADHATATATAAATVGAEEPVMVSRSKL